MFQQHPLSPSAAKKIKKEHQDPEEEVDEEDLQNVKALVKQEVMNGEESQRNSGDENENEVKIFSFFVYGFVDFCFHLLCRLVLFLLFLLCRHPFVLFLCLLFLLSHPLLFRNETNKKGQIGLANDSLVTLFFRDIGA